MGVQIHGDRRVFWLSAVTILAFAVMIARLFYVQVLEHDFYVKLADKEQIKQFTLRASRGEIYAMDGDTPVKLVMNTTVYTVWADPTLVTDKQKDPPIFVCPFASVSTVPTVFPERIRIISKVAPFSHDRRQQGFLINQIGPPGKVQTDIH